MYLTLHARTHARMHMCVCFACGYVEVRGQPQHWSSHSASFETGSLAAYCSICQSSWPLASGNSPSSCYPRNTGITGPQACEASALSTEPSSRPRRPILNTPSFPFPSFSLSFPYSSHPFPLLHSPSPFPLPFPSSLCFPPFSSLPIPLSPPPVSIPSQLFLREAVCIYPRLARKLLALTLRWLRCWGQAWLSEESTVQCLSACSFPAVLLWFLPVALDPPVQSSL